MRGKGSVILFKFSFRRITPAYAGKSIICIPAWKKLRDHPRLCGEKFVRVALLARIIGSPPPMRGKVSPKTPFSCLKGITPAYAGKRFQKFR